MHRKLIIETTNPANRIQATEMELWVSEVPENDEQLGEIVPVDYLLTEKTDGKIFTEKGTKKVPVALANQIISGGVKRELNLALLNQHFLNPEGINALEVL